MALAIIIYLKSTEAKDIKIPETRVQCPLMHWQTTSEEEAGEVTQYNYIDHCHSAIATQK